VTTPGHGSRIFGTDTPVEKASRLANAENARPITFNSIGSIGLRWPDPTRAVMGVLVLKTQVTSSDGFVGTHRGDAD
jgi:hypothetical protein